MLSTGCAHAAPASPRAWTVVGGSVDQAAQAQQLVSAARSVLPDLKGYLAAGGRIVLSAALEPAPKGRCFAPPPRQLSGCSGPGRIEVLWPHPRCAAGADLTCSALAHELAHLGLASGGGYAGPVDVVSEERAEAGGLLIIQRWRSVSLR
jgi:hypothetical protein